MPASPSERWPGPWLARPLTVITPTIDADVLAILAVATASFSGREVHRVAGRHSERGVRNALHRLWKQGIVTRERVGMAYLYEFNRDHLAAPHIEGLARLRAELFGRITSELETWASSAEFVAQFGSAARGDMRPDSDIDLFVVRPDDIDVDDEDWRRQLADLARDITAWTGNDARVLELAANEVRAELSAGARVLGDICGEGIVLYGPRSYLIQPGHLSGGAPAMADTKRCTDAVKAGRLVKARQFRMAADTIATIIDDEEIADAYITLCVHAGVAAADVICCGKLGRYHHGEDHHGATSASLTDQKRAGRAVDALVRAAEAA